ncbi:MAG: LamG domain-containing protein [Oscillospiraceae bacterium]|nr:LamG domain-containing protein [Oscillospiraceae bacterium]
MNVKTINLTGGETKVSFDANYPYFWVQNFSDSDVYMSVSPNITPDADGVILIPAKSGGSTGDVGQTNTVYLSGSGKVQIFAQYNAVCPFKSAAKGGDGKICSHITDGLVYQTGMGYKGNFDFSTDIILSKPVTVEFCGVYTNIPSTDKKGRWFEIDYHFSNLAAFMASQNNDFLEIFYEGYVNGLNDWILDGETGITIAPNEYATISAVHTETSLLLYKNGMFVKAFNATKKYEQFDMRSIYIMCAPSTNSRDLNGSVNLRIYNRKLTDSEILHNANVDKSMYFRR